MSSFLVVIMEIEWRSSCRELVLEGPEKKKKKKKRHAKRVVGCRGWLECSEVGSMGILLG